MSHEAKQLSEVVSDVAAQLDAAAHNALHATHRAAAATSDFYGRQLMAKQQEIFALRDRVTTLTEDNAKLFGWQERAKQLDVALEERTRAYNELLTQCGDLMTRAAVSYVPAAAEPAPEGSQTNIDVAEIFHSASEAPPQRRKNGRR